MSSTGAGYASECSDTLQAGRFGAHWIDFLEHVETWIPPTTERVYAILDNLSSHRTTDVLLFLLTHPLWEMVFQPKYAAYLNLSSPGGRTCGRWP
jgi:hypothetical protein